MATEKKKVKNSKLRIRQIRSIIGGTKKQKAVLQSLGLKGINREVVHEANDAVRGMIQAIPHLLQVTEE